MITIDEIMTANPLTLGPADALKDAGKLMREQRIRHVPIVDGDGVLAGLITQRDLLAVSADQQENFRTADVMRINVFTVAGGSSLRGAALLMQKHKIGSLVVVEEGRVVGIITDTDYVSLAINLLEQLEDLEPQELETFEDDQ